MMLFLNDVWVNWFEGEATGYNVCHFHEWKKEDPLELLEQVPVLKGFARKLVKGSKESMSDSKK